MTDDGEFLRATADWLDAGSDRTPPHAIDAVLLAVRSTRQERALPFPAMPFTIPVSVRLVLVAAALITLALVAFNLLAGGHNQAPTDTLPGSISVPLEVTDNSDLGTRFTAGKRYVTADPFPVQITFSGPEGWEGNIGGPNAVWIGPIIGDQPVGFDLNIAPYKDACQWDPAKLDRPPSTVAGVVNALAALDGVEITDPSATIGGRQAVLLTATAPGSLADCVDGTFNLWRLPLGTDVYVPPGGTQRIWVVDGGTAGPLVISAEGHPDWPPQLGLEIDQLIGSLEIKPTR